MSADPEERECGREPVFGGLGEPEQLLHSVRHEDEPRHDSQNGKGVRRKAVQSVEAHRFLWRLYPSITPVEPPRLPKKQESQEAGPPGFPFCNCCWPIKGSSPQHSWFCRP